MNSLRDTPRLRRPGWLPFWMLFASMLLATFGITPSASRAWFGAENQPVAEEQEERVSYATQHRLRSRRVSAATVPSWMLCTRVIPGHGKQNSVLTAIVGHRLANGLLAPRRC